MSKDGLKQRQPPSSAPVIKKLRQQRIGKDTEQTSHPAGEIKHGALSQGLRMFLFALYFISNIIAWVDTVR